MVNQISQRPLSAAAKSRLRVPVVPVVVVLVISVLLIGKISGAM